MAGHLCLKWNNHSSAFLKSISKIQQKERFCDATIACQGSYFPVHRVILSTCSEYFEEIFDRMQCQHPYIVFKDIDPKEMELLLNYMYQGEVNVIQESLPNLIKAAEALRIKGLAVPDDLPSGKKRSTCNPDNNSSKRRAEDHRKKTSSNNINMEMDTRPNLVKNTDPLDDGRTNQIKQEPVDLEEYSEKTPSEDFGNDHIPMDTGFSSIQGPLDPNDDGFPPFKPQEEVHFIKTENEATPECYENQSSSWDSYSNDSSSRQCPTFNSASENIFAEEPGTLKQPRTNSIKPSSYTSLPAHLAIPSNTKNRKMHQCPYCHYNSSNTSTLKTHIMFKHTGQRPFPCTVCPKRFTSAKDLRVHMRIHTGELPFQCPKCFRKFRQKVHLKGHMVNIHSR